MEKHTMFIGWKTQHTNISILSKRKHKFNRILTKILARNFVDIDKIILKFSWKYRELEKLK